MTAPKAGTLLSQRRKMAHESASLYRLLRKEIPHTSSVMVHNNSLLSLAQFSLWQRVPESHIHFQLQWPLSQRVSSLIRSLCRRSNHFIKAGNRVGLGEGGEGEGKPTKSNLKINYAASHGLVENYRKILVIHMLHTSATSLRHCLSGLTDEKPN